MKTSFSYYRQKINHHHLSYPETHLDICPIQQLSQLTDSSQSAIFLPLQNYTFHFNKFVTKDNLPAPISKLISQYLIRLCSQG